MDFNSGNVIGQRPLFTINRGFNFGNKKDVQNTTKPPMVSYVKDGVPTVQFNETPYKPSEGTLFRIVGNLYPNVDKALKHANAYNKYLEENSFTGKNINQFNEFDLYNSGYNRKPEIYNLQYDIPTFYAGDVEPDDYSQYIDCDNFQEIIQNAIESFEAKIAQRTATSKDYNNAKNAYRTFVEALGSGNNDLVSRIYQIQPRETLKISQQINELKALYSSIINKQQEEIERLSKLADKNLVDSIEPKVPGEVITHPEGKVNNSTDYNSVIFFK